MANISILTDASSETTAITTANATSLTCNKPSGVADGDLLVAQVICQTGLSSGGSVTAPSGWTMASAPIPTGTGQRVNVFFVKPISSASAETATTYTFTTTAAGRMAIKINRALNVDLTNPVDAYSSYSANATAGPITIPSTTTVTPGALVLAMIHFVGTAAQSPPVPTDPSGWTRYTPLLETTPGSTGSDDTLYSLSRLMASPGATGTTSVSYTPAQSAVIAIATALRPRADVTAPATGSGSLSLGASATAMNPNSPTASGGLSLTGSLTTPPTASSVVAIPSTSNDISTASDLNAKTKVLAKPANTSDGDLLVAVLYSQPSGSSWTAPAGWTERYHATAANTRGLSVYTRPIPSAAAETDTSYTFTCSFVSRNLGILFRMTNANLNDPIDAYPVTDVYGGSVIQNPSINTVHSGGMLVTFSFSQGVNETTQTFDAPTFTSLANVTCVISGGSTSSLGVNYTPITSAGPTGLVTVTPSPAPSSPGGFMMSFNPTPVPVTASGSISFSATSEAKDPSKSSGSLTLSGSATLPYRSGTATLELSGSSSPSGSASATSGNLSLYTTTGDLAYWLSQPGPRYSAHRNGFYATYGEFTLEGYRALIAWNRSVAWNIDVWQTTDNEWVASHDQTTGRVLSGPSLDITQSTWTQIQSKRTLVGNNAVTRIDDIVAIAPPGTIFFIDNKRNQNQSGFLSKLDSLGLGPQNVIHKNYVSSNGNLAAMRNAGYLTWGYGFDNDMVGFARNQSLTDWLGFDYAGTQANWNTIISYGRPSYAHIMSSLDNKNTADSKAATAGGSNFGYMVSRVADVVPPSVLGQGSLTLSGSAQPNNPSGAASGSLSLTGNASFTLSATATAMMSLFSLSAQASAPTTATGSLTLQVSAAQGLIGSNATGQISLLGLLQAPRAKAVATGSLSLSSSVSSSGSASAIGRMLFVAVAHAVGYSNPRWVNVNGLARPVLRKYLMPDGSIRVGTNFQIKPNVSDQDYGSGLYGSGSYGR